MAMSAEDWNPLIYGGRSPWRRLRGSLQRLGLLNGALSAADAALRLRNRLGLQDVLAVTSHDRVTRDLHAITEASRPILHELAARASRGTVLFPHFRGSPYLELFEVFLAHRLRFDGYRPLFVQCGGLPICNNYQLGEDAARNPEICRRCTRNQDQLLRASGHDFVALESTGAQRAEHRARTVNLDVAACQALVYCDVPVGELTVPSVARHLRRTAAFASNPDEIGAWRDYAAAACAIVDRFAELLDGLGQQPALAVIPGGWFMWHAVAEHMLRQRQIPRAYYETALHDPPKGNRWVFSRDVPLTDPEWITPLWKEWRDVPLTAEENAHLDRELSARRRGSIYHPAPVEEVAAIRAELNLPDDGRPVFVLFTGLTWDYAIYGRGVPAAFNDMTAWVADTLRFLADQPVHVVVRIHPAEAILHEGVYGREHLAERLQEVLGDLPANVRLVPPTSKVSSYVLTELASTILVYASTIGLETAIAGKRPLIMAAYSILSGRGFGIQPANREAYVDLLRRPEALPKPSAEAIESARRFTYLYFFRTSWPLHFFNSGANGLYSIDGFRLESLDALRPGKLPHLDHIAGALTGQGSLAMPRTLYTPPQ